VEAPHRRLLGADQSPSPYRQHFERTGKELESHIPVRLEVGEDVLLDGDVSHARRGHMMCLCRESCSSVEGLPTATGQLRAFDDAKGGFYRTMFVLCGG